MAYNIDVTGETPRGAEFAVRIRGDSMEPYIHDGSIAYVNRDPLVSGDVGIFCVDGEMLCKQYVQDGLGMVYLFSLNRARADADVFLPRDSGRSAGDVNIVEILAVYRRRVPRGRRIAVEGDLTDLLLRQVFLHLRLVGGEGLRHGPQGLAACCPEGAVGLDQKEATAMSFGQRLRERRKELGISQGELAKALGVSLSAISNYENGQNAMREDVLLRLFRVLEIEPNYLYQDSFTGKGFTIRIEYMEREKKSTGNLKLSLDIKEQMCYYNPCEGQRY